MEHVNYSSLLRRLAACEARQHHPGDLQPVSTLDKLIATPHPSDHPNVNHPRDPRNKNSRNSSRAHHDGHFCVKNESSGWILRLTAVSAGNPERLVRCLTGAVLADGGWILTRSSQGNHSAELDFEFARTSCIEIYSVLIAAGLSLSRDSHIQLRDLCPCTRNLLEIRALEIARVVLTIHHSASAPGHNDSALPCAC